MSSYNAYNKNLDDLYFNMLEYFNFEKEFTSNLPKNYISSFIICLVDAEEIENWKSLNSYDFCLEFLDNCDNINFQKFQIDSMNQNQNIPKNFKKFKIYETLDEVCHSLKKGGRISIIGNQFLCYINKVTYAKKCFKCYTKNNQLIIYFGEGKSIFIPKFFPNKILDSENVFIVDLPGDKDIFLEAIFDNKMRYQNMYESIKSCGNKLGNNLKMSMSNLLSYDVDKNELKKFKNYNFYMNEEEKNNNVYENKNVYQPKNVNDINYNSYVNQNNNNDIIYNYNNNYYINYIENGEKQNIDPNYLYLNNGQQFNEQNKNNVNIDPKNYINYNININEYPRDTNENYNIDNNYNYYQEGQPQKDNMNLINKGQQIVIEKYPNDIKEKDEQNLNMEIGNQNKEEQEKEKLHSNNLNINENKETEENNKSNNYIEDKSQNQIDQEKEAFYLNDLNNKETLLKKENENKEKSGHNSYIDSESQNHVDQEKAIFFINYSQNQKTNPELKDLEIEQKDDNKENIEEDFCIQKVKSFPSLGLDNVSGYNSYINSTLQCLINTYPLVNFFLGGKNINKITEEEDEQSILPSFLQILKKLWTNQDINLKSLNPEKFINNLKKLGSSFDKEEENDIGELIIFLLEKINLELKENEKYKEDDISIIHNSFFGGEKELITECSKCSTDKNEQKDSFKLVETKNLYYLMFRLNDVLDFLKYNKIKESNNINIYDCLNYFESPKIVEQNGKICEKCGNKEEFFITSKIKKCQDNLMILLNKNFNKDEKDEDIKFELNENLEMKNYIKENENQKELNYYLYAVICLNISFGENKNKIHHVAFCKSPVNFKWYKYDDSNVEIITDLENEVEKVGTPVALFYQKSEI